MGKLFFSNIIDYSRVPGEFWKGVFLESTDEVIFVGKLKTRIPAKVINCIDAMFPNLKGKCFFDEEHGMLNTKDNNYWFHFDPIHKVLEIKKRS